MISIKVTEVKDHNSVAVDEQTLKDAISETRWCLGVGVINGNHVDIQRKKTLVGYEYRFEGKIITANVECWNSTEFIEWRDK
jgi:hypothetical protein